MYVFTAHCTADYRRKYDNVSVNLQYTYSTYSSFDCVIVNCIHLCQKEMCQWGPHCKCIHSKDAQREKSHGEQSSLNKICISCVNAIEKEREPRWRFLTYKFIHSSLKHCSYESYFAQITCPSEKLSFYVKLNLEGFRDNIISRTIYSDTSALKKLNANLQIPLIMLLAK